MNNKPDNIVSERIIKKLVEKQLLSEDKKEEWIKKIALGRARSEDWNLLSDIYTKENKKKNNNE